MPIVYARTDPRLITRIDQGREDSVVLIFDPVLERSSVPVGDQFRRLDPPIRSCDCVVFRGTGPNFVAMLRDSPILAQVLAGRPALALVAGSGRSFTPNEIAGSGPELVEVRGLNAPSMRPILSDLREAEIKAILERTQAVFASERYHFALPSGIHADQFVRLGAALRNAQEVERIADWVLPYLDGDCQLLGDTGSMLPLLMTVRDLARIRHGWTVEIGTLEGYPADSISVSTSIDQILETPHARLPTGELKPLVAMISVSSTNRLCRLIKELSPPGTRVVVVCDTADERPPCDVALASIRINKWKPSASGRCERCKVDKPLYIHSASYERIPTLDYKTVKVLKRVAIQHKWFWTIADQVDAVRLHVDMPYFTDSRHFSVYVDVERLLGHSGFRAQCLNQLRALGAPELTLVPSHQTSHAVGELVGEALPDSKVVYIPSDRLDDSIFNGLSDRSQVLVADDVIVTGSTMLSLRSEIYRACQARGVNPAVSAFVVVARPPDMSTLAALRNAYAQAGQGGPVPAGIPAGYQLLLPLGRACPWCEEHHFLQRMRDRLVGDVLRTAEDRIRKLEGELEPQLMMTNARLGPGLKTLGSFFGDLRQKAAFAAGMAAAQTIRQDLGAIDGGRTVAVADLDHAITCYYEAVLLGSILRTLERSEVRVPELDARVEERIARIIPIRAYPGVVSELVWAAVAGKVPARAIRELLGRCEEEDRWLRMLASILDISDPV